MRTYTAFCRQSDGTGTTWIQEVEAADIDAAQVEAVSQCADDWQCGPLDVKCVGIAAGSVDILFWDDEV
jgi:hypothetical protein